MPRGGRARIETVRVGGRALPPHPPPPHPAPLLPPQPRSSSLPRPPPTKRRARRADLAVVRSARNRHSRPSLLGGWRREAVKRVATPRRDVLRVGGGGGGRGHAASQSGQACGGRAHACGDDGVCGTCT